MSHSQDAAASEQDPPSQGLLNDLNKFITLDFSALQGYLSALNAKIGCCEKENSALRQELDELKAQKRFAELECGQEELISEMRMTRKAWERQLKTLRERGLLDATDDLLPVSRLRSGSATPLHGEAAVSRMSRDGAAVDAAPAGEVLRLAQQVDELGQRLSSMERRTDALWQVKETDVELRAALGRLQVDMAAVQEQLQDTAEATASANSLSQQLDLTTAHLDQALQQLQEQLQEVKTANADAEAGHAQVLARQENDFIQLWDRVRETEVAASEQARVEEGRCDLLKTQLQELQGPLTALRNAQQDMQGQLLAVESRVDSVGVTVNAAVAPLHSRLTSLLEQQHTLQETKLDRADAVTQRDVSVAVATALDHAGRGLDGTLQQLAGLEDRVDQLHAVKADKDSISGAIDLVQSLTTRLSELAQRMDGVCVEVAAGMDGKADVEKLRKTEEAMGARITGLEGAVLKGLKMLADKVVAALAEKTDVDAFNTFCAQVKSAVADLERRLGDFSPLARATSSSAGRPHTSTCLSCDSHVRTIKDLRELRSSDGNDRGIRRTISPERLPALGSLTSSLTATNISDPYGAAHSARLFARKQTPSSIGSSGILPPPSPSMQERATTPNVQPQTPLSAESGSSPGAMLRTTDVTSLLGEQLEQSAGQDRAQSFSTSLRRHLDSISTQISAGMLPAAGKNRERPPSHGGVSEWETRSHESFKGLEATGVNVLKLGPMGEELRMHD